jgi:hypothetical protein
MQMLMMTCQSFSLRNTRGVTEGESERESPCVRPSLLISSAPPPTMSTCVHENVCVNLLSFRKALDIPFYRYKEMSSYTMGCSYVLKWLAEKCLEPCT